MTFSIRKVLCGFIRIAEDASILSHSCHHLDEHAAPPDMLDSEGSVLGISTTERAYDNWSVGLPGTMWPKSRPLVAFVKQDV
jgi:hypothetical protein